MLFSVLTREGKVSRHNFTLKCPIPVKQKQILVGSSFRARFPHSAQLSSLMESGTQFSQTETQKDGHC